MIPLYEEQLSDLQATRTIQWITVTTGITPIIDALKEEFDRKDTILSLREESNPSDWSFEKQKKYEQILRIKGREIVGHCKKETNRLCTSFSSLSTKQKLIFYVILPIESFDRIVITPLYHAASSTESLY